MWSALSYVSIVVMQHTCMAVTWSPSPSSPFQPLWCHHPAASLPLLLTKYVCGGMGKQGGKTGCEEPKPSSLVQAEEVASYNFYGEFNLWPIILSLIARLSMLQFFTAQQHFFQGPWRCVNLGVFRKVPPLREKSAHPPSHCSGSPYPAVDRLTKVFCFTREPAKLANPVIRLQGSIPRLSACSSAPATSGLWCTDLNLWPFLPYRNSASIYCICCTLINLSTAPETPYRYVENVYILKCRQSHP